MQRWLLPHYQMNADLIHARTGLKTPKGDGECSMVRKVPELQTYRGGREQFKMRMVKPILVEPKLDQGFRPYLRKISADAGPQNITALLRCCDKGNSGVKLLSEVELANRAPNRIEAPLRVNVGYPKLVIARTTPIWVRSFHSTRSLRPTAQAVGNQANPNAKHKISVTNRNHRDCGGKGNSCFVPQILNGGSECCR